MVGEQWWQVVRSGTPRVQGYPTPHKRHGRRRGQAVKAGQGPPRLRGAQRPLLPDTAAAPSPTKRDGVGAPVLEHGAQRRAGCLVLAVAGATRATHRKHTHPSAGVEGAPSGGGRATTRRGLDATAPGPAGVGGGQHHGLRGTRLTRTLCGDGSSRDRTGQWMSGVWLVATRSEQQATRAGQGAQDITGVACSGAPKQSFSGSLWPRYMRQPVMLSWPSANLPRRPARLGRARCPDWPVINALRDSAWL